MEGPSFGCISQEAVFCILRSEREDFLAPSGYVCSDNASAKKWSIFLNLKIDKDVANMIKYS